MHDAYPRLVQCPECSHPRRIYDASDVGIALCCLNCGARFLVQPSSRDGVKLIETAPDSIADSSHIQHERAVSNSPQAGGRSRLPAGAIRFRLFCCYMLAPFIAILSMPVLGRLNVTLATYVLKISSTIVVLGIVALPCYIIYRLLRYAAGFQSVISATSFLKGRFIHSWPYLAAHLSVIFLITLLGSLTSYRLEYQLVKIISDVFFIALLVGIPLWLLSTPVYRVLSWLIFVACLMGVVAYFNPPPKSAAEGPTPPEPLSPIAARLFPEAEQFRGAVKFPKEVKIDDEVYYRVAESRKAYIVPLRSPLNLQILFPTPAAFHVPGPEGSPFKYWPQDMGDVRALTDFSDAEDQIVLSARIGQLYGWNWDLNMSTSSTSHDPGPIYSAMANSVTAGKVNLLASAPQEAMESYMNQRVPILASAKVDGRPLQAKIEVVPVSDRDWQLYFEWKKWKREQALYLYKQRRYLTPHVPMMWLLFVVITGVGRLRDGSMARRRGCATHGSSTFKWLAGSLIVLSLFVVFVIYTPQPTELQSAFESLIPESVIRPRIERQLDEVTGSKPLSSGEVKTGEP